jgi:hypothetical protein
MPQAATTAHNANYKLRVDTGHLKLLLINMRVDVVAYALLVTVSTDMSES